jgi:uncharacterized protein (UPF0147 family)
VKEQTTLEDFLETPPWEWPKSAGKKFWEALTNRQAPASDRLIAAELAGDLVVMNDKLADALMAILHNSEESDQLRAKAAISLGPVLEQADLNEFDDPGDTPITERTFQTIQNLLRKLYADADIPEEVRRRILEAAVRAPQDWQQDAIRKAYSTGDRDWMLTAVFAMRWMRGFDPQILEALRSSDAEIHYEAVEAAGTWELEAAWPHIAMLVENPATPKPLLLAAIGATGGIRPNEARETLSELADSDDEDIAAAAEEAIAMAEGRGDFEDEEEDTGGSGWIN